VKRWLYYSEQTKARAGHEEKRMITLRPANQRGHANHGWLDSYHTFSFADYYDAKHMGFRALRVINEDRVAPGGGFPTHPHRDMEILTYVLEGGLQHQDSMGNGSVIRPGDVQRMSAGSGVTHSEFNASSTEPVHFLQIWITPARQGLEPGYEQKTFDEITKRAQLRLIASPDGREGSVTLHQDVNLYATVLKAGENVQHLIGNGRHAWIHVAKGAVQVDEHTLQSGDAAAISEASMREASSIAIKAQQPSEVLIFDLG